MEFKDKSQEVTYQKTKHKFLYSDWKKSWS